MNAQKSDIEPIDEESQFLIDQLYSIVPTAMKMPDGSTEEVNADGSIGLLAYGYKGIIAWRKKREELYGSRIYSPFVAAVKKMVQAQKEGENDK